MMEKLAEGGRHGNTRRLVFSEPKVGDWTVQRSLDDVIIIGIYIYIYICITAVNGVFSSSHNF
jgi:hypothetical protein